MKATDAYLANEVDGFINCPGGLVEIVMNLTFLLLRRVQYCEM